MIAGLMKVGRLTLSEEFKLLFMENPIETFRQSLGGKLWVSCRVQQSCHWYSLKTEDSVDLFGHDHEFTKLVIDLKGKDPDDAFSSIPYEKVRLPWSPHIIQY